MFQNLFHSVKRRILRETKDAFLAHPVYANKTEVHNKYPYEKRLQFGCVLRGTSGNPIRMSADNYLADLESHIRIARFQNYPGTSIEWVKENSNQITGTATEDVSLQLGPHQRRFFTEKPILAGQGNTHYADNPKQVVVTINGIDVLPEFVDGQNKIVMLSNATGAGDVVKVSYYYRVIGEPGLYAIDFVEADQFMVDVLFIIDGELLIDKTTGLETEITLAHTLVHPGTDFLHLRRPGTKDIFELVRGVEYTIDYHTGKITFINPLPKGQYLMADYKYAVDYSGGPYTFKPYQDVYDAIPGVVLYIGRGAQKGDKQVVIVTKHRERQSMIYGGHWDMNFSLSVISKDPAQMEEMTDILVNHFWAKRKNVLEFEGITLNSVTPSGESEEVYMELTGDMYFESTIDIALMSEWQRFVPYLYDIKHIMPTLRNGIEFKGYTVSKTFLMTEDTLTADMREVVKYPTTGYERLT